MHRPFADRRRTSGRRPDPTARRAGDRLPGAVLPSAPPSALPPALPSADVARAATGTRRTR